MKTMDKDNQLERVLDAMESADKKELLYAISELSSLDIEKLSKLAPIIRSAVFDDSVVVVEENMKVPSKHFIGDNVIINNSKLLFDNNAMIKDPPNIKDTAEDIHLKNLVSLLVENVNIKKLNGLLNEKKYIELHKVLTKNKHIELELNKVLTKNKYIELNDVLTVELNDDDQEPISDEENEVIEENYGDRSNAPMSDFVEYKDGKQFYELLMKDKKEKGWKFLDEK